MNLAEDQSFHLSFKGRLLGPFPLTEIKRKYASREIGGLHSLLHEGKKIPLHQAFPVVGPEVGPDTTTKPRPDNHNNLSWVWMNNQRQGPFTTEEIHSLMQNGQLTDKDLFWDQANNQWNPLRDLRNLP